MTENIVVVVGGGGGGGVLAVVDVEGGWNWLAFQQFNMMIQHFNIMIAIGPKALVLLAVKYLGSNI